MVEPPIAAASDLAADRDLELSRLTPRGPLGCRDSQVEGLSFTLPTGRGCS
jgi:hypothetical protein